MDQPTTVTATEASRAFSDLLHRVCYGGESFVIKKGNRLMARIVPVIEQEKTAKSDPVAEIVAPIPPAEGLTQEESDYYQTVVAQLKQMIPETCE